MTNMNAEAVQFEIERLQECCAQYRNDIQRLTAENTRINIEATEIGNKASQLRADNRALTAEVTSLTNRWQLAMGLLDELGCNNQWYMDKAQELVDRASGGSKSDPAILWMGGDDSWCRCSECGEELHQLTLETGVYHDCGKCGHKWWEGDYVQPTAAEKGQTTDAK